MLQKFQDIDMSGGFCGILNIPNDAEIPNAANIAEY